MSMWQDIRYVIVKNFIDKKAFKKEQVDNLLFALDGDIQRFYREKMDEEAQVYAEKVKHLEAQLYAQQEINHQLQESKKMAELNALDATKRAEILENENKMLKHQLDEMDFVTRKTLDHIRTNIYIGQDVVNTLASPNEREMAHYLEKPVYEREPEPTIVDKRTIHIIDSDV